MYQIGCGLFQLEAKTLPYATQFREVKHPKLTPKLDFETRVKNLRVPGMSFCTVEQKKDIKK